MPELTCEQRIAEYYKGRMETIGALVNVQSVTDNDNLTDAMLGQLDIDIPKTEDEREDIDLGELQERAQERIWEMPLSVEVIRVVKILLGTGGPGDWFEATVDDDGSITRIEYHFNDWFDHADINVSDDDDARAFCEQFTESVLVTQ